MECLTIPKGTEPVILQFSGRLPATGNVAIMMGDVDVTQSRIVEGDEVHLVSRPLTLEEYVRCEVVAYGT